MTVHELRLLGEPTWSAPAGPVKMPGRKPAALLWYVAAHLGASVGRSQLASLFWGDHPEAEAKANLTKNLSRLRLALPVWPIEQTRDAIAWRPNGTVRTDLEAFLDLTADGSLPALRKAVALWRGPFLTDTEVPDCSDYEQWLLAQRESLERRLLHALATLADAAATKADWTELEAWCEQALAIDRLQDRFHRWLMLALAGRGERNAALAHYSRYRQLLLDELGVEPEPGTTALRDQLLAGGGPDAPDVAATAPAPTTAVQRVASAAAPAGVRPASALRPPPSGPLVGRARELADIMQALRPDPASPAPVVFLHGDAGIGKTRLSEEVIREWDALHGTVLIARCYKETATLPYVPFAAALTQAERTGAARGEPLPPAYLTALAEFLPEFEPSRIHAGAVPSHDTAQPGRPAFQVWQGFSRLLELLPGPVLLIVDDLHKADDDSMQMLAFLARRPPRQQLAVLVTGRKGAFDAASLRLLRELERERCLIWHEIGPLPRAAIGELTASVLGAPDPALARALYARTGGHPLYTIELLRAWQRVRHLPGGDDASRRIDDLPLPDTLQAVIDSRFDALSPSAEQLLTAAAIFGQPVSFACLQYVAELPDDEALSALEELLRAEVLQESAQGVTFTHELLRQGAASRNSQARRQQLHRRAYDYLLTTWADAAGIAPADFDRQQVPWTTANDLGSHAMAGGLWEEALAWNEAGARSCLQTFRMPIATKFWWRAVRCLIALPETPERRDRLVTLGLTLTADFLMFPGNPWHPKPNEMAFTAQDLTATSSRPPIHAARAALGGDYVTVRNLLEHMLEVLPDEPTPQRSAAVRAYGSVLSQLGELELGVRTLRQAAALDRQLGNDAEAAVSLLALSALLAETGASAESEQVLSHLLAAATAVGDSTLLATIQTFIALAALTRRDWDAVATACPAAMARAAEVGFIYVGIFARLAYGPMLFAQGDLEAAVAAQRETVTLVAEQERGRILVLSYAWLAEISAAAGDADGAFTAARAGWELAQSRQNRYGRALCARACGLAALAAGDADSARRWLREAHAEAVAIGAQPLAALCGAALSELRP